MSEVNLDELKKQVEAAANRVKDLKSSSAPVDKETIGTAVSELLELKKTYADNNNGIGVDGKPFEAPLSKAEKKARAKAEKEKGPAKQKADPNSAGAQKKAAKKAAAKAKKEAAKASQGGSDVALTSTSSGVPPANNQPGSISSSGPPATPATKKKSSSLPPPRMMSNKVPPMQLVINPNVPLTDRPVAALTAAVLTNTIIDYDIVSNHLSRHTCLGTPEGSVVTGDFAMARYIVRRAAASGAGAGRRPQNMSLLGGESLSQQALVDSWMDYAQSVSQLPDEQRIRGIGMTLEHALQNSTHLAGGPSMSMADICLFAALGFPVQLSDKVAVSAKLSEFVATTRWLNMMAASPNIQEAVQLAVGIVNNTEAVFDPSTTLEPLADGMNLLEGATPGRVVTRFPPEPSGYLHIGHAKAALLNDYYARRYQGRLIVRFDDTNPSKEKEEFQEAIVEDLATLGIKPDVITYTSDYFDTLRGYAELLIQNGLAYMDDTPQEQMKAERLERKESKNRNQTPEESMKYFKLMCSGAEEGAAWCLRARIDMQSVNGTMRDPVIYRQNLEPHHRLGTTYKAYPTYDLACPIVDSLEGVTHALRTTEYNDRDEQYQWVLKALNLRRVRIHAFARMNFVNTVLSKRKLTWFVENGYVTGWDDPRFPTVRGVVRRGLNVEALRNFMYSQGASRRVVNMVWSKFWAENKKEIDKDAKRFMAIDKNDNVSLTITNAPDASENAFLSTDYHPKNPSLGKRVIRISKQVLLEKVDTEGISVGEDIVLLRWGVVRISKVDDGLEGDFIPDGDFKAAKRKLTWLANVSDNCTCVLTEFDNLVTKDKLDEDDKFEDFINPNTMATTDAIGDPGLKTLQQHDVIQLERRGFYRVDRPYINEDKPIILFMVPDGKEKSMSGMSGKICDSIHGVRVYNPCFGAILRSDGGTRIRWWILHCSLVVGCILLTDGLKCCFKNWCFGRTGSTEYNVSRLGV